MSYPEFCYPNLVSMALGYDLSQPSPYMSSPFKKSDKLKLVIEH